MKDIALLCDFGHCGSPAVSSARLVELVGV